MASGTEELTLLNIYGRQSWRTEYANALFPSDESLRWFLGNDGVQDHLIGEGLIFVSGRRLMTAEPRRLVAATIEKMKARTRQRINMP